jgi:hypothetical protein
MHTKFWSENLKGKCNVEDLDIDGRIRFRMDLRKIGWEGVDWIHLAQDRDHWWTLVNTVMSLQVPKKARNFLTS